MNKADFIIYKKEDIPKIPRDAKAVHIGYKMSIEDIGEIIRTRKNVKAIQFPPSIADQLHPFVGTMLDIQGIKKLAGYADRYDSKLVSEARQLRRKGWKYEKIARRIRCRSEGELRSAIQEASNKPGSEGAMLKLADFPYNLTGRTNQNIKYKKELSLDAIVLRKNKVAKTEKTFYYHCGLKANKGHAC
ncbi:MAG: DUF1699 family protein [Methanosarcinales archaeon]|nr:MAG: DUF1699 family protein [Methanosarcinales archaeon]